ncbi:hypothetical protein [Paraburkholderia sp.]|uniref:hypothetical protein n=1 Tax=Paraburkholderia sp. TaxID=1926495 RepID=UPI0023A6F2AA|nr:hypothetical protein [Paraburkholderia sp.]MDE1184840.1 hypothetical protein [Paraburkholderia sp.]
MKAICVTPGRELEVRDIPTPNEPAPGHVLIDMDASAINHGDKTFLKMPTAAGNAFVLGQHDVWGASGAGRVIAVGAGVPVEYMGRQVAIYRSLDRRPESVGLWCERAHVPYMACLILPEHVRTRDYCGSLVNVMTAYAFLDEIADAGHKGVIVTAGNSATGHALAALARSRNMPAIFLVRTTAARDALSRLGVEHVIVTTEGLHRHARCAGHRTRNDGGIRWRRRRPANDNRTQLADEFDDLFLRVFGRRCAGLHSVRPVHDEEPDHEAVQQFRKPDGKGADKARCRAENA